MVEKCDSLKVVKISNQKNRFLVNLRSFFSTYKIFPGPVWYFPVSSINGEYCDEKTSSLVALRKGYSFFRNSTDFGYF